MKRFTKICLIVCGVLAAIGLLCCVVAACMGFSRLKLRNMVEDGELSFGPWDFSGIGHWNWDLSWDSDDDWYEYEDQLKGWTIDSDELESKWTTDGHSYDPNEVRRLDVEYGFGTVILEESESGKLEIESNYRSVWGNYSRSIKCGLDGSTMKIRDKSDKKIFRMKRGISDATLVIRLPKDYTFEKINLEFGAAKVDINTRLLGDEVEVIMGAGSIQGDIDGALIEAREAALEVGAGEMTLSGIRARKLDMECGVGTMELADVTAGECSLECGIGNLGLEVTGRQEDFDYEIECGIGQVMLGDSSYTGLGTSKTIKNSAGQKMDIDCGIGQVVVSFQE